MRFIRAGGLVLVAPPLLSLVASTSCGIAGNARAAEDALNTVGDPNPPGSDGGSDGDPNPGTDPPVDPPPPVEPPPDPIPLAKIPGLESAVPGEDTVFVTWRDGDPDVELALFAAESAANVFSGSPIVEAPVGTSASIDGLTPDSTAYIGLGARIAESADAWLPVGAILSVRTRRPIFVDPTLPAGGDGSTPATAFNDPVVAALDALVAGGGNVFLRGAAYDAVALPVFDGVDIYGGFGQGFALEARDPRSTPSILNGVDGLPVVQVVAGVAGVRLDGLEIDGNGIASVGIDIENAPAELRGVVVQRCVSRGIRVRAGEGDALPVALTACESSRNLADGVSAAGSLDLRMDGCSFVANAQEGVDVDDLVAATGRSARVTARDCFFFGNSAQGLDVDLSAPLVQGPAGGTFEIVVRGGRFERNGEEGLLVDLEFENEPAWSARVEIGGSSLVANGGHGMRIDADAEVVAFIEDVLATANDRDGIAVTSESHPGLVVATGCVALGNGGAGVSASGGNYALALTHSILGGNAGEGLGGESPRSASSSIAFAQRDPWSGVSTSAVVTSEADWTEQLVRVPSEFALVVSADAGAATLSGSPVAGLETVVEVDDDGVARSWSLVDELTVTLDPAPTNLVAPALLTFFQGGESVNEDVRLLPGSDWEGLGAAAPGATAVDPGPFGLTSPRPPGRLAPMARPSVRVDTVRPAPGSPLVPADPITLVFSEALDTTSVDGSIAVVGANGAPLFVEIHASGTDITISPPAGGWPAAVSVDVFSILRGASGAETRSPLRISY